MKEKIFNIYKQNIQIIKYLFIGVLTTLINLIVKYLLLFTILNARDALELQISVIISWAVAILFAYFTNKKYVFESKNKNIFNEIIKFISARITTLVIEMVYMWFFITFLKFDSNIEVIIWTITCQILIIVLNYLFSKLFVFKKK